jgi:MoxR-like ATPase
MDRFMVRLSLGYPKPSDEKEMLSRKQQGNPLDTVRCMADKGGLAAMRQECERTYVSDKILEYIIRLNNATRSDPAILQGASPRASLAVTSMSKAAAWVQGRDYVLPADVKLIYPATVAHRIILTPDAEAAGRKAEAVVDSILKSIPAPVAK